MIALRAARQGTSRRNRHPALDCWREILKGRPSLMPRSPLPTWLQPPRHWKEPALSARKDRGEVTIGDRTSRCPWRSRLQGADHRHIYRARSPRAAGSLGASPSAQHLVPIRIILARHPGLPQVACFDHSLSPGDIRMLPTRFAIPENLYCEGVRRYGFHGLSYEYIADRLPKVAPRLPRDASSSPISAAALPCARWFRERVSKARWASPPSMAYRWGRGRDSWIRASFSIS